MKNGMKQTVIGEIPLEWEVKKLEDICSIQIGGTPSRSNNSYWDKKGETQNHWVAISDLKSRFIASTKERISDLGIRNSNCRIVPKFTVLMSFKLSIGKMAYAGVDLYTNEAIAAFLVDRKWIDNSFLYYVLPTLERETDVAVKGETLNKAKLLKTRIPLPPISEQRKIGEILSTLDEKVDVIDEQLIQTRELRKGLMQRLLTKGIGHTQFKDSPIGKIPTRWEAVELGQVFGRIVVGYVGSISNSYCEESEGVPLVRTLNVRNGHFESKGLQYVSPEFHRANKKAWVTNGDILIARVGANMGMTCKVSGLTREASAANVIIIKQNQLACTDFYAALLGSEYGQKQISVNGVGGAQAVLNTGAAQKLIVPLPPLTEQRQIAEILTTLDEKIGVLKDKKAQYHILKKGLMQQLLTGQRRVRVAEQVPELI